MLVTENSVPIANSTGSFAAVGKCIVPWTRKMHYRSRSLVRAFPCGALDFAEIDCLDATNFGG